MVSIVSGSGTGLSNTSRNLLGGAGELNRAQYGRNGERVTINAANGNLIVQDRDEYLVGLGQNLDLLRTYNSLAGWDGDNGDGWRISYYRRVQFDAAANVVKRIESDGSESAYAAIGNGQYRSTDGAGQYDVVSFDATTRTWTWVDGDTGSSETYRESMVNDGNFLLREIRDTEGHATTIAYSGSLISRIAMGDEWIDLTYEAGSSRNDAGVQATYTYDGLNRLLSVKDANQATTTYTYADSGRKTSITLDNGQMTVQLYGLDGRLITSTSYNPAGTGLGATRYTYDADGRLRTMQDPTGRRSWNFFDDAGRLQAEVDAAGQLIEYLRDAAGRVVQEIRYATRLGTSTLAGLLDASGGLSSQGLSDVRPTADAARDRIQTTYYDAAGRVQATQDPAHRAARFEQRPERTDDHRSRVNTGWRCWRR